MRDAGHSSARVEPDLESIKRSLDEVDAHIRHTREALAATQERLRKCKLRRAFARCSSAYMIVAPSLRGVTTSAFGWRPAGVIIMAMAVGLLFFVVSFLWQIGLFGIVVGAAASACLLFYPSDVKVAETARDLQRQLGDLQTETGESADRLRSLRSDLSAAEARQHRWAQLLRDRQYRESQQYRRQRLLRRNWKALRSVAFEAFLEEVFRELGYAVETTKVTGDQGGDLIVSNGAHRIAIQVKGYFHSVSNSAVQEAYTAKGYYKCEGCAVITNSRFTPAAKDVANQVGCVLIDEDRLPALVMGQSDLWQLHLSCKGQPQQGSPFQN